MKYKIDSLEYLKTLLVKELSKIDEVSPEYLNESGKAAREAYAAVIWHLYFHDDIESLRGSKEFKDLLDIEGKNSEYYKIIRMVLRSLSTTE